MKKFSALIVCAVCISCNGVPYSAPIEPQRVWIDAATRSDTIITNVNNTPIQLYYAEKNWQSSPDTNLTHGYRQIAIKFNRDSNDKATLTAQNFIDTAQPNPARIFVLKE